MFKHVMNKEMKKVNNLVHAKVDSSGLHTEGKNFVQFFGAIWVMVCHSFEGKTMMERFVEGRLPKLHRPSVIESFKQWPSVAPSVYEVQEIKGDNVIVVDDIFTHERTHVLLNQENYEQGREPEKGELLLTVLLPAGEMKQVFAAPLQLLKDHAKERKETILAQYNESDYQDSRAYMNEEFLNVLLICLYGEKNSTEDNDVEPAALETNEQQEVVEQYAAYMAGQDKEEYRQVGELLWRRYCEREEPNIRKAEVFSATLSYLIETKIAKATVTKKAIATHFGVSPSTLSKRLKELESSLAGDVREVNKALEQLEKTNTGT
ncbi:hypothetical protein JCM19038_846 [Geomicrobium sp. JCM 19038]|nr:hypothetical protein JCM19038_846 [Geomicrobium sp. JCM 19038]